MAENSSRSGIGLSGVLFCIFLVLKLIGVIDWSWWWITAPLWIAALFVVLVGVASWLFYRWIDKE